MALGAFVLFVSPTTTDFPAPVSVSVMKRHFVMTATSPKIMVKDD